MKDDGICMPAKTRFGNQTFPFEGAARCSRSRYAGEKRSMDLLMLGSSLSCAIVLLSPDTSWHHRDATPQRRGSLTTATATALLPLPTQVVENRREVWLRLSPKICICCVEINFLTCRSCTEGLLQYRSGGISHVAIAFLLDPPEHLSRGGSSPAKCGRITPC